MIFAIDRALPGVGDRSKTKRLAMSGQQIRKQKNVPLVVAVAVVVVLLVVTFVMRQRQSDVASGMTGAGAVDSSMGVQSSNAGNPAPSANAQGRQPLSRADAQQAARRHMAQRSEARKRSVQRSEELRLKVSAQFNAEKVDPTWAPGKEVELQKISSLPEIVSNMAAPIKLDVDCKSSMCRIDGSFASSGDAEDWTTLYMSSVGNRLPSAVVSRVRNPDGTTSVQIYGRGR
ncbi:MAG: hypothetical protein ACREO8_13700 [Luteimonas sp.]